MNSFYLSRTDKQCASSSHNRQTLHVTSFNVEGVVPNLPYLHGLSKTGSILCLQETWLWHFEKDNLKLFLPNYDYHALCADSDNFISNFHAPRGRAGVAILWPMEFTKYIKRLPVGNTRIIAIEISTNEGNICLINCYMPLMDSGSTAQYIEHLDVLQSIIDKYIVSHRLVVCGDFNGTVVSSRSNQHDRYLNFVPYDVSVRVSQNSLTDSFGRIF